jgi:trehalose 6-phosphate synthase
MRSATFRAAISNNIIAASPTRRFGRFVIIALISPICRNAVAYFRVNEHFARKLNKLLSRDDMIWVHDYHLIPIARFRRQMGCTSTGFFFSAHSVAGTRCCSAMPAYQRILRSFGAYDVVGFQTEADADNFHDCIAAANAGRAAGGDWCEIDGRRMHVRAFPMHRGFRARGARRRKKQHG